MHCSYCKKLFTPKNKRVKLCSNECRVLKRKEQHDHQNHRKYNRKAEGKYKCPFCGGYYKALLRHVYQRHEMTGREFKEHFGLKRHLSFIQEDEKEIKREAQKQYPHTIQRNLVIKGSVTRYKKGQKGTPYRLRNWGDTY